MRTSPRRRRYRDGPPCRRHRAARAPDRRCGNPACRSRTLPGLPSASVGVVHVEREGSVATLTLDRPDALNALSLAMVRELRAAVFAVADDVAIRCIVLTGAGRAFCAGGDIKEFAANASR